MSGRKRKSGGVAPSAKKKLLLTKEPVRSTSREKYRQWSEESMTAAMETVKKGGMGLNRAAVEFGIPKTTLKDRISGKVIHGTKSGRVPYLTHSEEEELYNWVVRCASIGYPKRRDDVIGIVRKALQSKSADLVENFKGNGWWLRFKQRWPKIRLRKGDALAQPRANAVNAANLKNYFDLLEQTLKSNELFDSPNRIWNMDESGLPLDHKPSKVIAVKGTKRVHCRTSGNKMQITILACANAVGTMVPPMVIFEGKRLNPEWTKGEVPCTLYGMSDKGWTDMELFSYWLKDLFIPSIPPARPVLLLLDGHSSHYEPESIRYAATQGVVVLCLPPHTTHVSQPLDVSFFKPLKTYWSEVCHRYMQDNPGRVVTKYQFSSLFSTAWYKAARPANIVAGFRKVGVYPYDPMAIDVPDIPTCDESVGNVVDETGSKGIDDSSDESEDDECELTNEDDTTTFTEEQLALFETRYENG